MLPKTCRVWYVKSRWIRLNLWSYYIVKAGHSTSLIMVLTIWQSYKWCRHVFEITRTLIHNRCKSPLWWSIIQIMYSDTDHMLISDGGLKAQGKMFCQVLSEAALRARALRNCLCLVTVPLSPDWCRATGMGFPLADSSISADRGILKLGWDNHYVLYHPPPNLNHGAFPSLYICTMEPAVLGTLL